MIKQDDTPFPRSENMVGDSQSLTGVRWEVPSPLVLEGPKTPALPRVPDTRQRDSVHVDGW